MAFLSLGLQNDEPPISSDQGKEKPSLREEIRPASSGVPRETVRSSDDKPSAAQRTTLQTAVPQSSMPMPSFLATHSENGNGHRPMTASVSNSESDDFDDRFDDAEPGSANPLDILLEKSTGISVPTQAHPSDGNGTSYEATGAPALPPGVEQLRRKLAQEEKRRANAAAPAPLAASVDSLSSSERQWVPTFSTFKFGYLPGRGLLYSTIGHEAAIFGLFLLFTYVIPTLHPERLIPRKNAQDHVVVYLPEVGGGSEGEKSPGAGQSAPQQPAAAPARASKGFAYPGRQAILSNPPNPTNAFQTIQRPLLVHPEPIHKLIPLPNIVQMAETRLPSDIIAPKLKMPHLQEVPKPLRVKQDSVSHRDAKFNVPVDAPKLVAKLDMPKLPAAEQPLPDAPKVQPQAKEEEKHEVEKPSPAPIKVTSEKRAEKSEKTAAPPSAAQIARMEMHGKAKEPLLSLSPMPLPAGPDTKIPNGEARGKFAIAPGGTLNPNSLTPGKSNGEPSTTPGTGQENAKAPNAAGTEVASNAGSATGHGAASVGGPGHASVATGNGTSGSGGGSGNTAGSGTGGAGDGKGRGAAGKGAGSAGSQHGAGSGTGAGSGSGTGSFPGITIQGGEDAEGAKNANPPAFTVEPQTSYGMTVVSTASSGGGLEDFGVFQNERIFTVYIPVKPTPEEADPTWTLQYAVIKDGSVSDPGLQQVVPPSAATSEWPQIPPALQKKYAKRQVVIAGVVGKDGKVSQISVKRTPDPRVSDPIAEALKKWIFHPAQVNNQPVPVKILVGIPLS